MSLLAVGVDTSIIALWLGHEGIETTQIYLHADLAIKERALARTSPAGTKPGRYRPPDTLVAFLDAPVIMPTSAARDPCPTRHPEANSA
jgi:integrase/recombinase XerD